MTALDTLLANSVEFTTLGFSASTTTDTVDPESGKSTSIACAVTTVLDSITIPKIYYVKETAAYVDTLNDEQLSNAIALVEGRELEFSMQNNEKVKVLKK